jgi:hypothetical protein
MPSVAFQSLSTALDEIDDLAQAGRPGPGTSAPTKLKLERALGRARVVLLSSHFERYIYAVNEEAISFLNARSAGAVAIPEPMRLIHSSTPVDSLAKTLWENRSLQLAEFVSSDGWLWSNGLSGDLIHDRLLAWMASPKPKNLVRYYKYWGIGDIFAAVTRTSASRSKLWLGVQELVDKRNNIAHGDITAQATPADVRRYMKSVREFCSRADRRLARRISRLLKSPVPW